MSQWGVGGRSRVAVVVVVGGRVGVGQVVSRGVEVGVGVGVVSIAKSW